MDMWIWICIWNPQEDATVPSNVAVLYRKAPAAELSLVEATCLLVDIPRNAACRHLKHELQWRHAVTEELVTSQLRLQCLPLPRG